MKKISDPLVTEMRREMERISIKRVEQVDWFNWLNCYLDCCVTYQHSTQMYTDPAAEHP